MNCQQDYYSPVRTIIFQGRMTPLATAVIHGGRRINYGVFAEHIERVTRRIVALGAEPGSRVGVSVQDEYLHWLITLALARMPVASVSLSGTREAHDFARTVLAFTDGTEVPGRRSIHVDASWFNQPAGNLPAFEDRRLPAKEACRIIFSSGTTGRPKKALLTHESLRMRWSPNVRDFTSTHRPRVLCLMNLTTIGGYSTPLGVWCGGGSVLLSSAQHQETSVQMLLRHAPSAILASPAQLAELVAGLPPEYFPTEPLTVYVGGSALPLALSQRARSRLTQSLFMIYGSTEAGTIAMAHASAAQARPGFSGHVFPVAEVEIVDEQGRALPCGELGEIRVRTDGMIEQYIDEPDTTERVFRDGWFHPGDLGVLDESGGLWVRGRVSEVMNFGGMKMLPNAIEEKLGTIPGVRDLAVVAIETQQAFAQPAIAVVVGNEDDYSEEVVVARFRRDHAHLPKPIVKQVSEIPRNEMGKVLRQQLASSLMQGTTLH